MMQLHKVLRVFASGYKLQCRSVANGVVTSQWPDKQLPTGNVANYVFKDMSLWQDKVATECSVTGRRYTYAQLRDGVARWSGMLKRLGIGQGHTVALALPNCPEYPIAFFGALAVGARVTTINITYTSDEISRILKDSGARVVIGDPVLGPTLNAALALSQAPTLLVMNGSTASEGAINLRQVLEDPSIPLLDAVELPGDETALLPYSSGTTGPPKGVAITHDALLSNLVMFTDPAFTTVREAVGKHQDVSLSVAPFSHMYGTGCGMTYLLHAGAKLVTAPKFDPNTLVDDISKHKVSVLYAVPPILNFLVSSPTSKAEDLASVKALISTAAVAPPSVVTALMEKVDPSTVFQEGYGMTELNFVTMTPVGEKCYGSVGKLLPNVKAKVIERATGEALPPLANGELCFQTPAMMVAYHNNPSATSETIDKEGWLHTGDVGHYDEQGFFRIVGRTKELIKVKGLQVSPSELEDVLLHHPDIIDAGVVGVAHERLGEAPRAFLVTRKPLAEEEIHKFLEPRVAAHKKLAGGITFLDELPRSAAGKILRKELLKIT